MDAIDISLSMILIANSRIPYKELAEKFEMSVNSIHKRVKSLVELGVIRKFISKLGFANFPGITNIIIFGNSNIKQKKQLINKLGENEYIYNVAQGSGNTFYIHAYLRNIRELDNLVLFVRKTGSLTNMIIGIDKGIPPIAIEQLNIKPLTDLDYLITFALKNNSRKSISDIALEVGASTKTIRRRLDRLTENFLVQFQIDWYPDKTGTIISMIQIELDINRIIDDRELEDKLKEKLGSHIIFTWSFSNLPNLKIISIWTQSMKELQELQALLLSGNFDIVDLTILIEGKMFPTWIDTFLEEKVRIIKAKSK
ncbi:MAG: winged helix-turn-helix transcriptional regulator [Candidatus Thorarchaeota archaeon]